MLCLINGHKGRKDKKGGRTQREERHKARKDRERRYRAKRTYCFSVLLFLLFARYITPSSHPYIHQHINILLQHNLCQHYHFTGFVLYPYTQHTLVIHKLHISPVLPPLPLYSSHQWCLSQWLCSDWLSWKILQTGDQKRALQAHWTQRYSGT